MTFYPEYEHTIRFLTEQAQDVHWTMNCPALIQKGSVSLPHHLPSPLDSPLPAARGHPESCLMLIG